MSLGFQRNGLVDEKSRRVLERFYVMVEQTEDGKRLIPFGPLL